jgi:hypothetical protein
MAAVAALCAAGTDAVATPLLITDQTLAAQASSGPGSNNNLLCRTPYGDAPQPLAPLSPNGTFEYRNSCLLLGGKRLDWIDRDLTPRHACLITPPQASVLRPLPLVVWFTPSLAPTNIIRQTNLYYERNTADLTGDPSRQGFVLLIPEPREIQHIYPWPDQKGYGWDNWYRNLDRSSPTLNVDVATADYFISTAEAVGNVDENRVYVAGWSDGAAFGELYALNTPGIAAAAVYSAPDPFSDVNDPCWQTPFVTYATPIYDLHNACDIEGTCQTSSQFHDDVANDFPQVKQQAVIVNRLTGRTVQRCDAVCGPGSPYASSIGLLEHRVWPFSRTKDMLQFMRDNPLKVH